MLEHELLTETGILIVRPKGPLAASDFAALSVDADAYFEAHGALNGLMICAEEFPGWENLDGAVSHFKHFIGPILSHWFPLSQRVVPFDNEP